MEIPIEKLSAVVLRGIIEEYVTREGTDYGLQHYGLEEKISQVKKQLERRQVRIWYDEQTDSCNIVSAGKL